MPRIAAFILLLSSCASPVAAQQPRQESPSTLRAPTRLDILRGEYGRYRANNDLLHYDLDIRVNPEKKFISGKNTIRFKMLEDDGRIQLELFPDYTIEKITMGTRSLKYERDHNTLYVDFAETLRSGRTYAIDVHYSGHPREQGRFGALAFRTDPAGKPWINTANEGDGSASWWPSKDQWRDEPDQGADIRVAVPNGLTNVSNGRFMGKTDLGDGYTRWHYRVHYPINSYNVSLNIAEYAHFSETHGDLTMDYFVLPANLEKAKAQFAQAKPMLEAFEQFVGKYPFPKDGFKLIEVPYSGMEHQSAVTYGNRYANGYLERDWTGVGVSLKFDFIIIHESGHEWFGNAISAADVSDMWIQEGWCNYLEFIYVEALFGREDAIKYANGYKSKVGNREPIITQRGIHRTPNQDMYFKGALFLDTLRNAVDDDARWWKLVRDTYERFKYQNIMTEDLVRFFSAELKQDMTPIFDQYLRRTALPILQLTFNEDEHKVWYRWHADERAFALPIKVGDPARWQRVQPTADWKAMDWRGGKDSFRVATELFYVNVQVLQANGRP
ncbi:MAG TPA: M1 family metallopeptidase [Vicinamibacterales bacterium]|nr:M1 family metallopeptidase [Vicinamibacterales bacterium]